jgi:tRNA (guanine37-N1)-methyltransferase
MKFVVLTIFPEMLRSFQDHGMIRRAIENGLVSLEPIDVRDFAVGRHRVTDDRPYGGGCGMVMKPEPLAAAIRATKRRAPSAKTLLLTPQGRVFDQTLAGQLAGEAALILVCGRYEGIDERIHLKHIDAEISIGDYVLTGGEPAAMVVIDAVARLVPGVLGGADSAQRDSFSDGLIEHAHYTRPPVFEGDPAPSVLLSGNHGAIEAWRLESSLIRTFLKRKDLLEQRSLSPREIDILKKWCADLERILQAQSSHGSGSPPGAQ